MIWILVASNRNRVELISSTPHHLRDQNMGIWGTIGGPTLSYIYDEGASPNLTRVTWERGFFAGSHFLEQKTVEKAMSPRSPFLGTRGSGELQQCQGQGA